MQSCNNAFFKVGPTKNHTDFSCRWLYASFPNSIFLYDGGKKTHKWCGQNNFWCDYRCVASISFVGIATST